MEKREQVEKIGDASFAVFNLQNRGQYGYRDLLRLNTPIQAHTGLCDVFAVSQYQDMNSGHVGFVMWISTPNGKQVWPSERQEWDENPLWYDEPWESDAWPGRMDMYTKSGLDATETEMISLTWPLVLKSLVKHGFRLDQAPKYL